jgi:adenylate kinase family enzyme
MTLYVSVLGIDGSGKSTVAATLPAVLAAECGVVAAGAGDEFRLAAPEEDRLAPRFHPRGLPLSARLARRLKRKAKELVDQPKRYPFYKLAQMLLQDAAARKLGARRGADVVVSDGNTLLSATGRAANYRRPASEGRHETTTAPTADDLAAVFRYVLDDEPLPAASRERLPSLDKARSIKRVLNLFRLDAVWLPDVVVFLDLSPERAVARIASRGARVDRHENLEDLRQARGMYGKTLEAFERYSKDAMVVRIEVDDLAPGEVLQRIVAALRERVLARRGSAPGEAPLGTTAEDLSAKGLLGKVLNVRYLFGYLVAKWFEGAWREPLFVVSQP